ncbi:hypothetical protein L2E82_32346 [Cichorium intybus]|uniref:Uncharacterized protein n=1 Tax=Cichorium intybus TaxID=13427 RepID=A0ACB9BG22_CICIN|nr:hypothetical protein L2E82_32346 [Cichorium intybus]
MPYLSGIGLLTKIMNHAPRKNIPVIMMSSDDSMGIVFNCLSKGAVDFLVKPIRKNELKNLWQHVWRKCHSSSGSESESGIRAHKPMKARSDDVSDDDDDDMSIGLTAKDGSDNGSGTQSSWSRKAVEVESTKYSWDQLPGPPDSTCAQVIRTRAETSNNYRSNPVSTRDHTGEDDKIDAVSMGKDLEIGVSRNSGKFIESNSKEASEQRTKCTTIPKANDAPALELSLKRPRDLEDTDTSSHKRNVLRQSDLSAFSRYNNTTSEAGKAVKIQSNSNGPPNQRSNGSSTQNNDMGSSTNIAFTKPEPVQDDKTTPPPGDGDFQVHHHHYHHHHHHHVHKTQPQQKANQDDGSSRNTVAAAPVEGDAANYGSASGSNNKSNGENGSSGQKGSSYEGGNNGLVSEKGKIGNVSAVDQDRLAQREAALNKFRLKRKERCFEKKVRYQSRKKLAEQRPRVRGQFVKQEVNGKEACS